jgi:hypothetical protein
VAVDVLNFSLATLSNEFIVGVAVAAIVISALVASSLFRNVALAIAAGAVVLLYLQGGTAALIATSKLVETEIKATPDFSQGLVIGLAISAVFLVGCDSDRRIEEWRFTEGAPWGIFLSQGFQQLGHRWDRFCSHRNRSVSTRADPPHPSRDAQACPRSTHYLRSSR